MTDQDESFNVSTWLAQIGLEQYADLFFTNDVTEIETLTALTEEDLEKLGISSLGHRKKLMAAIDSRKELVAAVDSLGRKPAPIPRPAPPPGPSEVTWQRSPVEEKPSGPWKLLGWLLVILVVLLIMGGLGL